MKLGLTSAAVAAALALATAADAQAIAYKPGTTQYVRTRVVKRSLTVEGQRQDEESSARQFITVTVTAESPDTLRYTIRLDSISVVSSAPGTAPPARKLMGAALSGAMSPRGASYTAEPTPADADDEVRGAIDGLSRFLIVLPPKATVGAMWTDTLTAATNRRGIDRISWTISTFRVAGDTLYAGQKSWRIERGTAVGTRFSGAADGFVVHVDESGTGRGVYLVSADGVYLGSSETQTVSGTARAGGGEIPTTLTTVTTVELLPQRGVPSARQ